MIHQRGSLEFFEKRPVRWCDAGRANPERCRDGDCFGDGRPSHRLDRCRMTSFLLNSGGRVAREMLGDLLRVALRSRVPVAIRQGSSEHLVRPSAVAMTFRRRPRRRSHTRDGGGIRRLSATAYETRTPRRCAPVRARIGSAGIWRFRPRGVTHRWRLSSAAGRSDRVRHC